MTLRLLAFLLLVATWASGTAAAQASLVGMASVIDGDTIDIHGQRIRQHGIDAPESGQLCMAAGHRWRCGQQAALALADKIARRPVRMRGMTP